MEAQSSILIRLKAKLRIVQDAPTAKSLLEALQDRNDLFKTVDAEIEAALNQKANGSGGDGSTGQDPGIQDPNPIEKYTIGEHSLGAAVIGFFTGLVLGAGSVELGIGFAIIGSVLGLIIALVWPFTKSPET